MTFKQSFQSVVFNNYCNFKGRASRSEYWWFVLAYVAIYIICAGASETIGDSSNILGTVAAWVLLLPNLGVTWRRLHDTGRGGQWFFVNFIPIIGLIWLLVLLVGNSEPQENRFGEVPEQQLQV